MSILDKLKAGQKQIQEIQNSLNQLVAGRKVRIVSDYNDQPIGRSRPSLCGTIQTVVSISGEGRWVFLHLADRRCGIHIDEVEFLDEEPNQEVMGGYGGPRFADRVRNMYKDKPDA